MRQEVIFVAALVIIFFRQLWIRIKNYKLVASNEHCSLNFPTKLIS